MTCRAQELCASWGGCPGLPIPDKPYGFCGRKVTLKRTMTCMKPWEFWSHLLSYTITPPKVQILVCCCKVCFTCYPSTCLYFALFNFFFFFSNHDFVCLFTLRIVPMQSLGHLIFTRKASCSEMVPSSWLEHSWLLCNFYLQNLTVFAYQSLFV